jgi:hypothetical protein
MQIRERLSLLLFFSIIFILCVLNFDSSDSGRMRAFPIQVAFEKIRIGMTEEELDALMASYQEDKTEHGQWRYWREGGYVVFVTVWPKNFLPIRPPGSGQFDGPDVVYDKVLYKESPKQSQRY